MKKKIKKKAKAAKLTPLGCLRTQVIEEALSAEDHPQDLRLELEKALNSARKALTHFGGQTAVVILYSSEKKAILEFDLRDDKTKLIAKAAVKALVDKLRATAVVFVYEAWVRPIGSISKEGPGREEALVASAKNRNGHLTALQRFHRLDNGRIIFEKPDIFQLDKNSSRNDTWLGNLRF